MGTAKAYHSVGDSVSLLDLVLEHGVLIPLGDRISRNEFTWRCLFGFHPTKTQEEAFFNVLDRRVLRFLPEETRHPGEAKAPETHTDCNEMLLGDIFTIYLQVGSWLFEKNGFVFDAAMLVEAGAVLRPVGFWTGHPILNSISSFIWQNHGFRSVRKAEKALEDFLDGILREHQLEGQDALNALRHLDFGKHPQLLWPGPLAVQNNPALLEIWRGGELI